jgi:hypothetical protein
LLLSLLKKKGTDSGAERSGRLEYEREVRIFQKTAFNSWFFPMAGSRSPEASRQIMLGTTPIMQIAL